MRTFETGATRDDDTLKNDYEGYLSPLVIRAFGDYMTVHRHQADGSVRASDNWQKGFGESHFDVCLKSKMRHDLDLWLWHRGWKTVSQDCVEHICCAILFNTMAYLHKILQDKHEKLPKV